MIKRIFAAALAVGIVGTSPAYAQMSHGDNAVQQGAMRHDDSRIDRHDNGNHNSWRKHHRHCRTEWRHHHRVRICR